jgi:hypothetical protein
MFIRHCEKTKRANSTSRYLIEATRRTVPNEESSEEASLRDKQSCQAHKIDLHWRPTAMPLSKQIISVDYLVLSFLFPPTLPGVSRPKDDLDDALV